MKIYDIVPYVQEKNDAVTDAKKKNDASCEFTIPLRMYKRRMMQVINAVADVQEDNVKEQVAEGSCKAQACSYKGTSGRCVN